MNAGEGLSADPARSRGAEGSAALPIDNGRAKLQDVAFINVTPSGLPAKKRTALTTLERAEAEELERRRGERREKRRHKQKRRMNLLIYFRQKRGGGGRKV